MKKALFLLFLFIFLVGCSNDAEQNAEGETEEDAHAEEPERKEMSKTDALYYLESITKEYMGISTHVDFDEDTANLLETGIDNIDLAIEEMEENFSPDDSLMLSVKELGGVVKEISETFLDADEVNAEMVSEGSHEIGVYLGELSRNYLDGELPPTVERTLQDFDEVDEQISEFIEQYNLVASMSDIELLDDSLPVEENGAQYLIFSPSIDYSILAIREQESLLGYSFIFNEESPYEELRGNALNAAIHVVGALDLDLDIFIEEFEASLSKENNSYTDNGYKITFDNHRLTEDSDIGMIISFIIQ